MMSAFIPHEKPAPVKVPDEVVNTDPFYPNFSLADFRREMRNDDVVTDERLAENFRLAIIMINALLATWKDSKFGVARLSEGEETILYKTAVYRRVKTYVLEQYRDIDTTKDGAAKVGELSARILHEQQREREAIRLLTGRGRTSAFLI